MPWAINCTADNGNFALDVVLSGGAQGVPAGGVASKGVAGVVTDTVVNFATKPGTIQTIGGAAELGEEGLAGPIGWAKVIIDGATFAYALAVCK
jgi:hypothetical protein